MAGLACRAPEPDPQHAAQGPQGAQSWSAIAPGLASDYDQVLARAWTEQGPPGLAMGVAQLDTRQVWSGTTGLAQLEPERPWAAQDPFPIGSVTKTMTASLIFLLAEDGALDLDDPLDDWVPSPFDGHDLRLHHLMSNTSGIASYNYVGSFDEGAEWTPEGLVQWAADHAPALGFVPGSEWEYSNTNWVLLGIVAEAASGMSYRDLLHSRLFGPLDLQHTHLWGEDSLSGEVVHGYMGDPYADVTDAFHPSFGWAAGAVVSTPEELARWGGELYGGHVLAPESLAAMVQPTELSTGEVVLYGMGAFTEPSEEYGPYYGHTGGIGGNTTFMYCLEDEATVVVVMSNTTETELNVLAAYPWSVVLGVELP